jgi:hypothetical protein
LEEYGGSFYERIQTEVRAHEQRINRKVISNIKTFCKSIEREAQGSTLDTENGNRQSQRSVVECCMECY